MDIGRRSFMFAGVTAAIATNSVAADYIWGLPPTSTEQDRSAPVWPSLESIKLWKGKPPSAVDTDRHYSQTMNGPQGQRQLWVRGVSEPELSIYRPKNNNGKALLVCPGGGYGFLSVQHEGIDVARYFTALGFTVFVLSYRLPNEGWLNQSRVPLQDAQRAIRLIKVNAKSYGLNPDMVVVMGFSAGGHLALDLATAHDEPVYVPQDSIDKLSAQPYLTALIYPVTTLKDGLCHMGTRENLLGFQANSADLVQKHSPLEHIAATTSPIFLVHSMDDSLVPVEASLHLVAKAKQEKVAIEAHFYQSGDHGYGLALTPENNAAKWPELFDLWSRFH